MLKSLPLFSIDDWKPYYGAFLRVAYRIVYPRRSSTQRRGRPAKPTLAPRADLRVAVVRKICDPRGRLLAVARFVLYGTLKAAKKILFDSGVGQMINTSFIERLHATMRGQTARLFRRTRAGSRLATLLQSHLYLWRDVYNWVRPHRSLQGRTPAMAQGLTDHRWTALEYVRYPVHLDRLDEEEQARRLNEILKCPLDPRKDVAG
jgi:hypothetical protein